MLLLRRNAYLWLRRCGEGARQEVSQPLYFAPCHGADESEQFHLELSLLQDEQQNFNLPDKLSFSYILQVSSRPFSIFF
jgi:hypothetical protein